MKVSVLMPTYEHEPFIAQAIDSYLKQNFCNTSELLISDDRSSDRTAEIARKYAIEYPNQIKVFVQKENIGLIKNYQFLIEQAKGEYLAILESDDLWVDPFKLSKQINYLDEHPDVSLSFTDWYKLKGEENLGQQVGDWYEKDHNQLYENLLLRNLIKSPTVIFRSSHFRKYCDINDYISLNFNTFDYPVWLTLARHHPFHYLQEKTSTYRYVSSSLSNNTSIEKKLKFEDGVHKIRVYIVNKFGKGDLSIFSIGKREIIVKSRHILRLGSPMKAIFYFITSFLGLIVHQVSGNKNLFKP